MDKKRNCLLYYQVQIILLQEKSFLHASTFQIVRFEIISVK